MVPRSRCPSCERVVRNPSNHSKVVALLGLSLLGMSACTAEYGAIISEPPVDNDGDGYESTYDCDDDDADIHPDAEETAGDGVDSNCDGEDDT